jgi:hypothetical protein
VIDNLNTKKHRNAQRDPHDIKRRQRRMPRKVTQAMCEEKAKHEAKEFLTGLTRFTGLGQGKLDRINKIKMILRGR